MDGTSVKPVAKTLARERERVCDTWGKGRHAKGGDDEPSNEQLAADAPKQESNHSDTARNPSSPSSGALWTDAAERSGSASEAGRSSPPSSSQASPASHSTSSHHSHTPPPSSRPSRHSCLRVTSCCTARSPPSNSPRPTHSTGLHRDAVLEARASSGRAEVAG